MNDGTLHKVRVSRNILSTLKSTNLFAQYCIPFNFDINAVDSRDLAALKIMMDAVKQSQRCESVRGTTQFPSISCCSSRKLPMTVLRVAKASILGNEAREDGIEKRWMDGGGNQQHSRAIDRSID